MKGFRTRVDPEQLRIWRQGAAADLAALGAQRADERGLEVLRRGFGDLPAQGERTRIGLSNSLGPEPPGGIGEDDIDVVREYDALIGDALDWLEGAALLSSTVRGRSELRYYRLTERGRLALLDGVDDMIPTDRPTS